MKSFERIHNPVTINQQFVENCFVEAREVIIQFSENLYNDDALSTIDDLCSKFGARLRIRFYGHDKRQFDCMTLSSIPNVCSLSIDCIKTVKNVEAVKELRHLEKLHIGIYDLTDLAFFDAENFYHLKGLNIGETKTSAIDLRCLENYFALEDLTISGHTKNIASIGALSGLSRLSLWSISKVKLDFVNRLLKLKTLNIAFGGRENIHEINGNAIEELSLTWIRGFNDLSNIGNFKNLKSLFVEDNIRLSSITFSNGLPHLSYVKIINCKTLSLLTGLGDLLALEHLRIYRTAIDFDSFIQQPLSKALNILAFYTGKSKIDKEIAKKLLDLGYSEFS